MIVCGLFNCFAWIFLVTLIWLIFVVLVYLKIFLVNTPPLWNCTGITNGNIDGNVCSIFNICGVFLRIQSKPFRFFISRKTIFNVIRVKYLLFHKLFYLTGGHSCWCERTFIHWMAELFTLFIHTKITITCCLFLFRRDQSISPAFITIHTCSFFMFFNFIVARTYCIGAFQLHPINKSNYRLNCFVEVSNCFVDLLFNPFRM